MRYLSNQIPNFPLFFVLNFFFQYPFRARQRRWYSLFRFFRPDSERWWIGWIWKYVMTRGLSIWRSSSPGSSRTRALASDFIRIHPNSSTGTAKVFCYISDEKNNGHGQQHKRGWFHHKKKTTFGIFHIRKRNNNEANQGICWNQTR